jgi:hypothetical protein
MVASVRTGHWDPKMRYRQQTEDNEVTDLAHIGFVTGHILGRWRHSFCFRFSLLYLSVLSP